MKEGKQDELLDKKASSVTFTFFKNVFLLWISSVTIRGYMTSFNFPLVQCVLSVDM